MSILLSTQGLTASYGVRPLFEGVSFTVEDGDRIGLIGPNGAGKSTLLRMLADAAGGEHTQSGLVSRRRGLRVGYLSQVPQFAAGATVASVVAGAVTHGDGADWERTRDVENIMARLSLAGPTATSPASRPRRRSATLLVARASAWRWRAELVRAARSPAPGRADQPPRRRGRRVAQG